jgi:poly(hydroxyalkanoate) depolymerase family esterase
MNILKRVTISANRFARGVGRRLLLLRPKRSPLRRFPGLLRRTSIGQESLSRPVLARPSLRGRWKLTNYAQSKIQARPATRLNYGLYLPHFVDASPVPLVVMLHGCQQTAKEFAQGTRMNILADQEGFAVLYPQQSKSANTYRCWNWYEELAQAGAGEAALIVATIAQVSAQHRIDPSRVYVVGLSAGASMAMILAIHYPHLIAAVGLHSGVVFGAANTPMAGLGFMRRGSLEAPENAVQSAIGGSSVLGMPAVLIHGDRDHVVHPVNLEQLVTQFKVLNPSISNSMPALSSVSHVAPDGQHDILQRHDYLADEKSIVRVYRIPDLEHAWSGGDGTSPFHSGEGPDASELMWEFLEKHRRRADVDQSQDGERRQPKPVAAATSEEHDSAIV